MATVISKINSFIDKAEFNRFGIMTMTVTVGSCWAGLAVMAIIQAHGSVTALTTVAMFGVMANAVALAQAGFRWVIWSFAASLIVSTLMIIGYGL